MIETPIRPLSLYIQAQWLIDHHGHSRRTRHNVSHIKTKSFAVLNPLRPVDPNIMDDTDLAGPLVFCLAFGTFLLLVIALWCCGRIKIRAFLCKGARRHKKKKRQCCFFFFFLVSLCKDHSVDRCKTRLPWRPVTIQPNGVCYN